MDYTEIAGKKFYFDESAADHAVTFFEKYLRYSKGEWAGKPFKLGLWQRNELIRPLFGWKRADGTRRYRFAYIEIPRKNGKSEIAAGIALYMTSADSEPGAEVYSAAGDKDQASIVFKTACTMVQSSLPLRRRCKVYKTAIVVNGIGASYKVLSSDAFTKHGLNAHATIFDELHVQKNRELWDTLVSSRGARRQPLVVSLTTAGFDQNTICWELHDYALKVQKGIIVDPEFLALIYAAAPEDDWKDPATWRRANPNLGVTITEDFLAAECHKAQMTPAYENTFRRLYLNQWTSQESRYIPMDAWDASAGTVDLSELDGLPCYGGLDLSSTTDLSSFVLVFPIRRETEQGMVDDFKLLPYFWLPKEGIAERARKDMAPYELWAKQGYLELTEGNVIDYGCITKRIAAVKEAFNLREVAFDRWGSTKIIQDVQAMGITVVPFGQGYSSMTTPTKELLNLALQKRLHHGGHPVLRWNADNVVVTRDSADNIKPDKAKSSKRIDGIVGAIMALDRAIRNGAKTSASVYDTRGFVRIG